MLNTKENTLLELVHFLNSLVEQKNVSFQVLDGHDDEMSNVSINTPMYCIEHSEIPFIIYYYPIKYNSKRYTNSDKPHNLPIIHLDEDLWQSKNSIVQNRLLNRMGKVTKIGARGTIVARIDKAMATQFLELNHLLPVFPGKYRYGLFNKGILMGVAIFSGGRNITDNQESIRSFELIRFCHKKGFQVVGGLSKLIRAFEIDFKPDHIMTYIDLDWSHNNSYKTIGFIQKDILEPICFGYDPILKTRLSPSEIKNGTNQNWIPKWNSGSIKMIKRLQIEK